MINSIQQHFKAYQNTPQLWFKDNILGIKAFEINHSNKLKINTVLNENVRLGTYVEQFVWFELSSIKHLQLVDYNIQITKNKITLGEIDALVLFQKTLIHLEVAYKFYLIDFTAGTNEIDFCIGPNKKDSLKNKLEKIRNHQFPILEFAEAKTYIKNLELEFDKIEQQVVFKAQLFLPITQNDFRFKTLNNNCLAGYFTQPNEIEIFKDCKFYIPQKKDWLLQPHTQVEWINYESFYNKLTFFHQQKNSPLCWVKSPKGILQKVFMVWW